MLTRIRLFLNAATRFAIVRAPTVAVIRALCVMSCWLLRRSKSVAAVYASGSHDRRNIRLFIRDIDLAIAVHRTPPGLGYEICRALHRRLRLVRLLNPFVRDVWQTILTRAQWPLFERYGYLFGNEDWRRLGGGVPWTGATPVNERLMLAAHWYRQHLWTAVAVDEALKGQRSLRGLDGSLKEARSFAKKLRERIASGSAVPDLYTAPPEESGWCAVAWSVRELASSADLLMRELDVRPTLARAVLAENGLAEPAPREARALAGIAEALDLDDLIAVIGTEGFIVLVTDGVWSLLEYARTLKALAGVYRETGVLTFIHTEASFSLAPLRRRLRVLRARQLRPAPQSPVVPFLFREQLLYQSLFIGTNIWIAAGMPEPRVSLEPQVLNALETYAFLLTGELDRDARPLRDALHHVASLDADLRRRVHEARDLSVLSATDSDPNAEQLFELGSVVFERLANTVAKLDVRSDVRALVAAS